jgi:hypothetical protein
MNLFLHGIGNGGSLVVQGDALAFDGGQRFDLVLTYPALRCGWRVAPHGGKAREAMRMYAAQIFAPK